MARAGLVLLAALWALPAVAQSSVGQLGVGRAPLPAEIAAWDIDIRPDGKGLPPGQGSVREGEVVFSPCQ